MAKGSLVFDPRALEFRRNERGLEVEASGSFAQKAGGSRTPVSPSGTVSAADGGSSQPETSVYKPEGYVDPTPRRRRRRKSHSSSSGSSSSGESATTWRGVMWGVILIMGVVWVYMLYSHGKDKKAAVGENQMFIPSQSDFIYE